MYTLSLEIINKCNLNCKYCYLGEKKNTYMSIDVAKKSVEIALHEALKQYDKTLLMLKYNIEICKKAGIDVLLTFVYERENKDDLLIKLHYSQHLINQEENTMEKLNSIEMAQEELQNSMKYYIQGATKD